MLAGIRVCHESRTLHRSLSLLKSLHISIANNDQRLYAILAYMRMENPSHFASLHHIHIKSYNPAKASNVVRLSDFKSFLDLPSVRTITDEGVNHTTPTIQQLQEILRIPNVSATTL